MIVWNIHLSWSCVRTLVSRFVSNLKQCQTVLNSTVWVWITLIFTQGHRVMGKVELVWSFCCKVTWSYSSLHDGWLCKGDDCKEVPIKYGEYGSCERLLFFLFVCSCSLFKNESTTVTWLCFDPCYRFFSLRIYHYSFVLVCASFFLFFFLAYMLIPSVCTGICLLIWTPISGFFAINMQ